MKTKNPKISVVMSVYNGQKHLKDAILSILNQTFRDFEFIIVNDGSTDDSLDIIRSFDDKRMVLINQKNIGLTKSLNKAMKLAKGKYIARMDADDIASPKRLETQFKFMEKNPEYGLCGSWVKVIDENNRITGFKKPPTDDKQIKSKLIIKNQFVHPALFIRKSILDEFGAYDSKIKFAQDYDFVLKIASKTKAYNINQYLLLYREGLQSISYSKMKESLKSALKSRVKALKIYGYPKWQYIYLIWPFISCLIPIFLKKLILGIKEKKEYKNLVLFFTRGIGLETWDKIGNLTREIKPYNEISKHLDSISFITYGKDDLKYQHLMEKNIEIVPKKSKLSNLLYSLFLPFIARNQIKSATVLKTNQMDGSWAAVIAKKLYRKKLIVRCGYEFYRFSQNLNDPKWKQKLIFWAEKFAYKNADKIILTSESDKRFVIKIFNIKANKIIVIPNYIDTDLFKSNATKKDKNRIIYVGRLEEQKNLFNLIRAMSKLPYKLIIIGSGLLKSKLNLLAKKINADVEFLGNLSQNKLVNTFNKSQIFILPSYYEGCPKTLLEAMSCQMPVIGTDVEGIREIINHKQNGILCKTDSKSIRRAIINLIKNQKLQNIIAKNARITIENEFSLEKMIQKELKIYKSLN